MFKRNEVATLRQSYLRRYRDKLAAARQQLERASAELAELQLQEEIPEQEPPEFDRALHLMVGKKPSWIERVLGGPARLERYASWVEDRHQIRLWIQDGLDSCIATRARLREVADRARTAEAAVRAATATVAALEDDSRVPLAPVAEDGIADAKARDVVTVGLPMRESPREADVIGFVASTR